MSYGLFKYYLHLLCGFLPPPKWGKGHYMSNRIRPFDRMTVVDCHRICDTWCVEPGMTALLSCRSETLSSSFTEKTWQCWYICTNEVWS